MVGPLNDEGLRLAAILLKMAGGRATVPNQMLMEEHDYWISRLDDPYHDAVHYTLRERGDEMTYVGEMDECPWCNRPMPEGFVAHRCDEPEVLFQTSETLTDEEAEQIRIKCNPYEARIVGVSGYRFEGWHLWAAVLVAVIAIFGLSRLFR